MSQTAELLSLVASAVTLIGLCVGLLSGLSRKRMRRGQRAGSTDVLDGRRLASRFDRWPEGVGPDDARPDEKVELDLRLHTGMPSAQRFVAGFLALALLLNVYWFDLTILTVACAVLIVGLVVWYAIQARRAERLVLTDSRLIWRNRDGSSFSVNLISVADVWKRATLLERLLGRGTIVLELPRTSLVIDGVPSASRTAEKVRETVDAAHFAATLERHDWWTDDPITSSIGDRFDRRPFIERVCRLLNEVANGVRSTVIGLTGPWGSGKTSTLNMIMESLDRKRWAVTTLNPWAMTGAESVVSELLAAVSAALPEQDGATKRARKALVQYGIYATPLLSMVPLMGSALSEAGKEALARLEGASTLREQAHKVEQALSRVRPTLVVIDDVDRLQPEELLALFKAVRALGRLPNVHYLLAYDKTTVLDVLSVTAVGSGDRASAFLEKIVTVRLDQPPTRPEHSEDIFNAGLMDTMATLKVVLTEDQSRRLADEREALLARRLTEPRTIAQFLAQLRFYLPLVGPTEIDLVDFVVLTFLRATYPRLYLALMADRRLLTERIHDQARLQEWRDTDRLLDLGVPALDGQDVLGALRRLFPLLVTTFSVEAAAGQHSRRRGQRVADPDHVERYFALTQLSNDLPDAVLAAAIDEWLRESADGEATARVTQVLTPNPRDDAACVLAARVLRRITSRAEEFGAEQSNVLMPVMLRLLPEFTMTSTAEFDHYTDAIVVLLGRLLSKADNGLPPEEILLAVARPELAASPLSNLLRALRWALPEPFEANLGKAHAEADSWRDRLIVNVTRMVWHRLLDHIKAKEDAPPEATGWLLTWLDAARGPNEITRLLTEDGLCLADIAARTVEIGISLETRRRKIAGFDAREFMRRLGPARVRQAQQTLTDANGSGPIDLLDISWEGRRRYAATQLLQVLREGDRDVTPLPVLKDMAAGPLANHEPSLLKPPGSDAPDITLQLAVILEPAATATSAFEDPPSHPIGHARERIVLELVEGSSVDTWLQTVSQAWGWHPAAWQVSDSDGRNVTSVATACRTDAPETSKWNRQTPMLLGIQLNNTGSTLLTIKVGLWLAELTADRKPGPEPVRESEIVPRTRGSGEQHGRELPLPAALSLPELHACFVALINGAVLGYAAHARLGGQTIEPPPHSLAHLRMHVPRGLGSVVHVEELSRVASSAGAYYRKSFNISMGRSGAIVMNPEEVAAALIGEWLLQAGYRNYERALHDLLARD